MRSLAALLLVFAAQHAFAQDILLVTQEPVGLRVGPAAHMPAMETLPAGSMLQGVERSGGWYRVRADRAVEGWVPLLSTRLVVIPAGERGRFSTLDLERILTAKPRLEEAAGLAQPVPSSSELRYFAESARLLPGRSQ